MKRTDLEKHLGKKITGRMQREPLPARYGAGAGEPADRRGQRERDKAAGLVPFAVKLPAELVAAVQARAQGENRPLNDVAADLLRSALANREGKTP